LYVLGEAAARGSPDSGKAEQDYEAAIALAEELEMRRCLRAATWGSAACTCAPSGGLTWDAGMQVQTTASLNFRVGALVFPVKTNHNGEGTCSISDVEEPVSGLRTGSRT
jgi:hypothetical protein